MATAVWMATAACTAAWGGLGLVGGDPATTALDPVVVLVDSEGAPGCTGMVIAPDWVLTAGHCLELHPARVWWTLDAAAGPDAEAEVVDAIPDPDRDGHVHDVALVQLGSDAPTDWVTLDPDPPAPGDPVLTEGFGADTDGGEAGTKRIVDLDVDRVDPDLLWTYTAGRNLCSGDSGAPLYSIGPDLDVVGVAGFVDPTCLGGKGGWTRMDQVLPFVRDHVPDPGPPPDTRSAPTDVVVRARGGGWGCSTGMGPGAWSWLAVGLGIGRRRPGRGRKAAGP